MMGQTDEGMHIMPVNKDFFWSMYCQGIGYGDVTNSNNTYKFKQGSLYTVFDTGSSHLMVPEMLFNLIV
jgi:hypothetical protein